MTIIGQIDASSEGKNNQNHLPIEDTFVTVSYRHHSNNGHTNNNGKVDIRIPSSGKIMSTLPGLDELEIDVSINVKHCDFAEINTCRTVTNFSNAGFGHYGSVAYSGFCGEGYNVSFSATVYMSPI